MSHQHYTLPVESLIARAMAMHVSDVLALESQMCEDFEKVLLVTKDLHDAHQVVLSLKETSKRHIKILGDFVKRLGEVEKPVTDKLITAVAGLFGFAASFMDNMKHLPATKVMSDIYVTIHRAIACYVMLITVSTALDNHQAPIIARVFINDWVKSSHTLLNVIPGLTMSELRGEGTPILDEEAAHKVMEDEKTSFLFSHEQHQPEVNTEPERAISSAFAMMLSP